MKLRSFQNRSRFVFIVLSLLFCALIVRLVFVQYIYNDIFSSKARKQHTMSIKLTPKRGEIYDAKGRVLAMSVPSISVFTVPQEIKDIDVTAQKLSSLLDVDIDRIKKQLSKNKTFVYIKRKVEREKAQKLKELDLAGIYFHEENKRYYPNGSLLSHVLGFVNIDNEGLEGIELSLNRYLKGAPGFRLSEKDAAGREIIPHRFREVLPLDGNDVYLTIDEVIQHIAETELAAAIEKFKPIGASVVVVNPKNGDILAMANWPTYDPNMFSESDPSQRRNRSVTDFFEPGSTFKTITGVSALNEGVVTLSDRFFCENGAWRVSGHTLHDSHSYGSLTFQEIIKVSSNIGICKVAKRLKEKIFYRYMKDFGFGARTGIDFPGEVTGILRHPKHWSKLSMAALPMGQELTVTPLQLTMAYAAVANGGILVKPRLIRKIAAKDGTVMKEYLARPVRRVVSQKATQDITTALKDVVGVTGTARRARLEGYSIAGKTGTAQKIGPDGRYSHTDFFASFIGFVPADNPQVVILVSLNEPKPHYYGGVVAAPAFKNIAARVLKYLNVTPVDKEPHALTKN
ncbi:MAG: penicillin-binding transpeptidase domain-containing protein [Candidatus Ancaeobacter aquaticus]|nr:penicillin-binding transpeptidase domain-containing protein [Candidatus Ancaeobacter aquaticus]